MRQITKLLRGSTIQIYRDQMLLLLCFAPYLAGIGLKIAIPLINSILIKYLNFDLTPYYLMADALILFLGTVMIGMMVGLLMLDERDDGICIYYSVTPLGGKAYLSSRLILPLVYSFITTLVVISFSAMGGLSYGWLPAPTFLSALNGIMMAMMLVSIASNKVEGLAVSKLLCFMIFGIPLAMFADSHLRIAGFALPSYWVMDMLIQASAGQTTGYILDFILGLACTSVWFVILYRIFIRKIR